MNFINMNSQNQQKETLEFFNKNAKGWGDRASGVFNNEVNMIRQRNDYVLWVLSQREKTKRALDVGCGTGDLVHEIAEQGVSVLGVDFAPEMIRLAQEHWGQDEKARFVCQSVFDHDFNTQKYDIIAANGFVEYISFEQLHEFLEKSFVGLEPGGSLVFGSRNRLFNMFTMNEFTKNEVENKTSDALLAESIALVKSNQIEDLSSVVPVPLPDRDKEQPYTGVEVKVRYQYTPVQLIKILLEKGFVPTHVSPIHIHGVVPKFKDFYPEVHKSISSLLQQYAFGNMSLIPGASSFMIHAKKM